MQRIKTFFEEARQEFKKVNWPTRAETTRYTLFVVVFSVALSFFLGILDSIFLEIVKRII